MKNTNDLLYRLSAAAEGEERAYLGDVSLLLKEAADEIKRLLQEVINERERCAKIAISHRTEGYGDYACGQDVTAGSIASEIRGY
jgi:hypothetical protein